MKGYYNKPEATAEAIDKDGWFHTGDIGVIDADGFLAVTDRKKDILVTSGGKKIAPQPIENLIKANTFFAEIVMVGNKRNFPSALVVPNFDNLETMGPRQGAPHGIPRGARGLVPRCARTSRSFWTASARAWPSSRRSRSSRSSPRSSASRPAS